MTKSCSSLPPPNDQTTSDASAALNVVMVPLVISSTEIVDVAAPAPPFGPVIAGGVASVISMRTIMLCA